MTGDNSLLPCYNRGCGQKFDPKSNNDGDCVHHPGVPIFHDTYKKWSCCSKKCTDFTEFLNIKGCTKSMHTNVKPPEPEKPPADKSKTNETIEVIAKPLNSASVVERPPFDFPQITLVPTVSSALLEQIKGLTVSTSEHVGSGTVQIGQSCKNSSCKAVYASPLSDDEVCKYHSGVPIFHEGLKYWSCCQKKTTDFSVFLDQPGCTEGKHTWLAKNTSKKVECRMDWHEAGQYIVVSVYAKKYQPNLSTVKLNPIHLTVDLFLIEENTKYTLDLELSGVVDVGQSSVSMLPTKVEIKLRKVEAGAWTRLGSPRLSKSDDTEDIQSEDNISAQVEAVDLSDL